MKKINSFTNYLNTDPSGNLSRLETNWSINPSSSCSKSFFNISPRNVKTDFGNSKGNISTNSNSLNFLTEVSVVSNSTYNIKRKINSILDEISARDADSYLVTGNASPLAKSNNKNLSNLLAEFDKNRKSNTSWSIPTYEKKVDIQEKNRMKRQVCNFSKDNRLTESNTMYRTFNKPMVNLEKPSLQVRADDLFAFSPTAMRQKCLLQLNLQKELNSAKNKKRLTFNGSCLGKESKNYFDIPTYTSKNRKSLFQ